jgi:outer membrane protein assembly factor BamA
VSMRDRRAHRLSISRKTKVLKVNFIRLLVVSCLALVLANSFAYSQAKTTPKKAPPPANLNVFWKLISVKTSGSQNYTQQEIVGSSGLQIGDMVNEDDFKKATQRLGETGVFANVGYSFAYSSEGVKLELQVADSDQFVPVHFDNFVWFSDQELMDKLRERVPLLKDKLPVGGELVDQVSDALQALLIESKIPGKADYIRQSNGDGPILGFLFTVTGHDIEIRNVEFDGAGLTELPLLQAAGKVLQGREYSRKVVMDEERLGFQPIYLKRGYLKARFAPAQTKVIKSEEDKTQVDVSVPVDPGQQYKLTEIHWAGNSVFSEDQLQPLIHLKAGEPADAVQLSDDLMAVSRLYGTKGYMSPKIVPVPDMDDATLKVNYKIEITEGNIYKMGEFEVRGLDDKAKSRMLFFWKLKEGDTYDSSYIQRFLKDTAKELPPGIKWKANPHEAINDDDTVDVSLTFEARPAE